MNLDRTSTLHKIWLKMIREILYDLGYGNDFLDKTLKSRSMKEIIGKVEFIEILNFCTLQKQTTREWGEKPQIGRKKL